jgi:hypothetical protein
MITKDLNDARAALWDANFNAVSSFFWISSVIQ